MIATITIEANNELDLMEQLDQIQSSLKDSTLEDNELMDGSYQIDKSNIEFSFEGETLPVQLMQRPAISKGCEDENPDGAEEFCKFLDGNMPT